MLTDPMEWKVNRGRHQQEGQGDRTATEVEEDNEEGAGRMRRDTITSGASVLPPLETQNSASRLLAQSPTSPTAEAPIPNSRPPLASLQSAPASTTSPPHVEVEEEEDDDDDPTSIQPPAYRRGTFVYGVACDLSPLPPSLQSAQKYWRSGAKRKVPMWSRTFRRSTYPWLG
ncbi:hypothetical protein M407DRAFT_24707 [Tulasnella calospora MUT 4182]|uniref:Uncharacterized protein n=1 Tax=Tulasnella calospora MUT 4182 TaxID=1051891 RepID=A0A0C3KWY9_9AGAM|nr:hypothetical protein M407DRAFT_24707 [Tulasnella calospora MUT 4182]